MNEKNALVFIVDDDRGTRESLRNLIRSAGLSAQTFSSAQEFLAAERPNGPGCLVLDVQLPGLSGLDLQRELAKAGVKIPIIFITGYGDIPTSVRSIRRLRATTSYDSQTEIPARTILRRLSARARL